MFDSGRRGYHITRDGESLQTADLKTTFYVVLAVDFWNGILQLLLTYINVISVEKKVLWTICPWKTLVVIFDIVEKPGCRMADLFCCTSAFSPSFSGTIAITLLLNCLVMTRLRGQVGTTCREVKLCFRQTSSTFTRPCLSRPTIQNALPQRQLLDFAFSEQVATSY